MLNLFLCQPHSSVTHTPLLHPPSLPSLRSIHIRPKWPFLPAYIDALRTHIPANKHANSANLPTNTEPNTLNTALKHAYMDPRDCYYLLISGRSLCPSFCPSSESFRKFPSYSFQYFSCRLKSSYLLHCLFSTVSLSYTS